MTPSVIEFPNELEIVTTREFHAPIDLVFDVMTKPEHVRHWFAPFEDQITVCSSRARAPLAPREQRAGGDAQDQHEQHQQEGGGPGLLVILRARRLRVLCRS